MATLDPRVRIVVVVAMSAACFALRDWPAILAALALALTLWRAVGLGFDQLWQGLRPLRVVFALIIIAQAFFYPGSTPVIPGLSPGPTLEGVMIGLLLCARVLVLACTVPILTAQVSADRLVLALTKLGLSYRIAFIVTTALNQVPVLRSDFATISMAQRLRGSTAFSGGGASCRVPGRGPTPGGDGTVGRRWTFPLSRFFQKLRVYPALVVPLVMTSMRRANLMAVAMDSRAFGSARTRSSIHRLAYTTTDAVVLVTVLVAIGALIVLDRLL